MKSTPAPPRNSTRLRSAQTSAKSTFPKAAATSSVTTCPANPLPPPDKPTLLQVPPKKPQPVCRLLSADLQCKDGRKAEAQSGRLYVVAQPTVSVGVKTTEEARKRAKHGEHYESSVSFEHTYSESVHLITSIGQLVGGCGKHLEWSVSDGTGSHSHRGAGLSYPLPITTAPDDMIPLDYPVTHVRVTADACEAAPMTFEVMAYPGDELKLAVDETLFESPFENSIERFFKLDKMGKAPGKRQGKDGDTRVGLGSEISQAWKEDPKSHRAYCETSVNISLAPLLHYKLEVLLWGVPIPASLSKWLAAGIYGAIEGEISLTANGTWKKWADAGSEGSGWGGLTGEIGASLAAKLHLVHEDVLSVEIEGATKLTVQAGIRSAPPQLFASTVWQPLEVAVTIHLTSWFELEPHWSVFDKTEFPESTWPVENLLRRRGA